MPFLRCCGRIIESSASVQAPYCMSLTISRLTPGTLRIKATTTVATANHATRFAARSTRNCITSLPTARLDASRSNWGMSFSRHFIFRYGRIQPQLRRWQSYRPAPLCSVQRLLWRFVRVRRVQCCSTSASPYSRLYVCPSGQIKSNQYQKERTR